MKKWLGEASALCGHTKSTPESSKNDDGISTILEYENIQLQQFSPPSSSSHVCNSTDNDATTSNEVDIASVHRCNVPKEMTPCQSSVAYLSKGNTYQVSSPCHHFCTSTVSVQLHPPRNESRCSNSGIEHMSSEACSSANCLHVESSINKQPPIHLESAQHSCNLDSSFHGQSMISKGSTDMSLTIQDAGNLNPSIYPSNQDSSSHHHSIDSFIRNKSPDKVSQNIENKISEDDKLINETTTSSILNCTSSSVCEFSGQHGEVSSSMCSAKTASNCSSRVPLCRTSQSDMSSSKSICSNGCGHWCTTCRVRVQVEVECVSNGQHSPSPSKRGNNVMSLPKRVRHKVKGSSKDGGSKKKKSPWSRLNCKLRSNKTDNKESEKSSGLTSCVCPTYNQASSSNEIGQLPSSDSSANSNSNGNGSNILNSIEQLGFLNPDYPVSDIEENARFERAREMVEGVDPPPGFIPILRETQNSLTLGPLTYNSVMELQPLLERLGRSLSFPYPSSTLMQHMGRYVGVGALMSRTVHTQVDYIHCLVPDLLDITNCGFYWGKMDRYEAERRLEVRSDGTFLLRDSAHEDHLFSVSFRRYSRSLHARIEQWNHRFSFDSHDPGVFASDAVCGLIEHYKDPALCMFYEPLLTNPLPRTFPFPLQHLCRATICSRVTYDGISNLELPKSLKNYLKEYHYKQRVRVRHFE